MNTLLEIGVTNAIVATLLACVVWLVTRFWRHPALVHALWVIVLVKLVTPPIVSIPWHLPRVTGGVGRAVAGPIDNVAGNASLARPLVVEQIAGPPNQVEDSPWRDGRAMLGASDDAALRNGEVAAGAFHEEPVAVAGETQPSASGEPISWNAYGVWLWLSGSLSYLVVSMLRVVRFHRALYWTQPASVELQRLAASVATRLGVSRYRLRVTEGRLAPLVWPIGRPMILLSRSLVDELSSDDLQTLLAHEFAHIRRKDHWVRWLELVASAVYWWHPVVWLARKAIHTSEEQACDAWAVSAFPGEAQRYASALFTAAQFASDKRHAAPSVASGLGSDDNLKQRIEHIMNASWNQRLHWSGWVVLLLLTMFVLPLSLRAVDAPDETAPPTVEQRATKDGPSRVDTPQQSPSLVNGELDILREQVKFLEDHAKRVGALFDQGLEGGSRAAFETASYELSRAKAELELAEGDRQQALEMLEEARIHAEQALNNLKARYDAGVITQDVLLQANRNLVDARQKLAQVQNTKAARTTSPAAKVDSSNLGEPSPQSNARQSNGQINILKEQVKILDEHVRLMNAAFLQGAATPDALETATFELNRAKADLSLAEGNKDEAVVSAEAALAHAEEAFKGIKARYEVGATDQEGMLQGNRNLLEARQKLVQVQNSIPADATPGAAANANLNGKRFDDHIKVGGAIVIRVAGTPAEAPIDGVFYVQPDGTVALGPLYDRVRVEGLSIADAEKAVKKQLENFLKAPFVQITVPGPQQSGEPGRTPVSAGPYKIAPGDVLHVNVLGVFSDAPIAGDFVVEPSGALPLGPQYGRVPVGGLGLEESENAIRQHLDKNFGKTEVQVTLGGWKRAPPAMRFAPDAGTITSVAAATIDAPSSAPLSLGVLRRIVEMKKVDFGRVEQLAKEKVVSTADVDARRAEMEIAIERLRQAERALKAYQIEVQIAEAEYSTMQRANEKTPNSVSALELEKAGFKLQLAKAKLEELAQ